MSDAVNHPSHYNTGKIEVIEVIEDQGLNFNRGNAFKYIARAGKKDSANEAQDLEKARWYLAREIELLLAAKSGRDACRPNEMKKDDVVPEKGGLEFTSRLLIENEKLKTALERACTVIQRKIALADDPKLDEQFTEWLELAISK